MAGYNWRAGKSNNAVAAEIRRETNHLLLRNEFIRRRNGYDIFGRTEPFYQRAKDEVQAQ